MKIWIDTSTLPPTGEQSLVDAQHLPTRALQQAASLYAQACGEDRWLVCNPTETGYIAVVDTEALHALEQFRVPKTVEEAVLDKQRTTHAFPLKALALLYHL